MKRWRVGTFSMGISLVMVGATLLISTWKGLPAFDILLGWWPIVFIMLGVEILLFIFFSKKEQPVLYYDMFSIMFVGVLCCFCVVFSLVTSSGVMNEIRYSLGSVEKTLDLPDIKEPISQEVKRIVIQANGQVPKIDKMTGRELHLFGSYRTSTYENLEPVVVNQQDVATIRTVGGTMYIAIKELSRRNGINDTYPFATMTLTLPEDIPFELRGADNREIQAAQ
ncbi:hypothetical protein [Paenibacillus eucommiae]|uniref:DUF5668 domain-containing protein n=1 Tax=Paenibacillus eucommiae TaxID=1355755 RepID=A0ABS4IYB0_9BACL|nr:hypothetical protein [Paenibacillus eucommiae]MBP1992569.1 hypothetical protein [Paenibacillus eucommiae]